MSQKNSTSDLSFNIAGLRFLPKKSKKNSETKISAHLNNNSLEKGNYNISPGETISTKHKNFSQSPLRETPPQMLNLPEAYKALEKELQDKKDEIKKIKRNFKDKLSIVEIENKKNIEKIEEKYKELVNKISENCEKKIEEIKVQYNQNISKINQQYLEILNEIRTMRTNTISLSNYYDKINELNTIWEKKLKKLQEDYEIKFKQISSKINENFSIEKVEGYNQEKDMLSMLSKIKAKHKISYYSYILELQKKYNEFYRKLSIDKNEKLENFKASIIKKFNSLLGISANNDNNLINLNTNSIKNDNINTNPNLYTNDHRKKSELVNYDTSKLNKLTNSIRKTPYEGETYTNNIGTVSKAQDRFSSDFESFNFNEDSLPNKDIQILSPPELIN